MFNLINLYKSLICFLKADLEGLDFHSTNETIPKTPEKQNKALNLNDLKDKDYFKEIKSGGKNAIGEDLKNLGLGDIYSKNNALKVELDLFLAINKIEFKPGDPIKLNVLNGHYLISGNFLDKNTSEKRFFSYDITNAIETGYLSAVDNVKNEAKTCLNDLKGECLANTNGGMGDYSSLQPNKAPYNGEQSLDQLTDKFEFKFIPGLKGKTYINGVPTPVNKESTQKHIFEMAKSKPEIFNAIQKYFGDSQELFCKTLLTAFGESTFNPDAENKKNKNGTVDRGLFQINSCHKKECNWSNIYDIDENCKMARKLYDNKNSFRDWYAARAYGIA